jgi:hypothetical protein
MNPVEITMRPPTPDQNRYGPLSGLVRPRR